MKNRNHAIILVAIIAIAGVYLPAYSDQHKKDEVTALINETESKLSNVRTAANSDLIRYEITKIENYIASSKKLISSGKIDQAFYEISIGAMYFQMIDARLDLHNAMAELEAAKGKLSQ